MGKFSSTNPFFLIGKPIEDEYRRQFGRIASFMVNPDGQVNSVLVERGDGKFFRYSGKQFDVTDEGVVLLSFTKLRVKTLCQEIPLIWRKDQALSELLEKKKIPPEMFNDLHKKFQNALNEMKANAKAALDSIDKQVITCNQQIKELQSAKVYLEIESEIGKIDERSYLKAFEMIEGGLAQVNAEKSDLEAMRNNLSNILLGETQTPVTIPQKETKKEATPALPPTQKLPEPPVMVHVKSTAKPGS